MSAALSTLKNHIRPLVWRTAPRGLLGRRGLHQDRVLRTLVERLVGEMPVTSFVETGTHTGETAAWVASRFPRLQVYSCEIDEMWYRLSAQRLRRFRNVHLAWQGSQTFLPRLISEGRCGPLPLFFLDAHWLEDWPLRAELQAITRLPAAAVVIDDFQVPDHPQFSYCHGPVGSSREAICNLDLIRPFLDERHRLLWPQYGKKEAFGLRRERRVLVGYAVLFQNLHWQIEALLGRPFVRRHFQSPPGLCPRSCPPGGEVGQRVRR